MKYADKYPQSKHKEFSPPPELQLEPDITYSFRHFPCMTCRIVTAYRQVLVDCPSIPCCSEECRVRPEGPVEVVIQGEVVARYENVVAEQMPVYVMGAVDEDCG